MEKKKRGLLHVVICVGLVCLIWLIYIPLFIYGNEISLGKKVRSAEAIESYQVLASIDEIVEEKDKLSFSGWIMRLDSVTVDSKVVLKEKDGREEIVLKTTSVDNEKVEKYYKTNWDFGEVGFQASIESSEVKQDTCYEVYVFFVYEVDEENTSSKKEYQRKIITGKYLYNGKLYEYDPNRFKAPNLSVPELQQVLEQGVLRAYDLQSERWIYQFENKLYYIFLKNQDFSNEEDIEIVLIARTSRNELLPEKYQVAEYDMISQRYIGEVYTLADGSQYQVSKVDLPLEYPLIYAETYLFDTSTGKKYDSFIMKFEDWMPGEYDDSE